MGSKLHRVVLSVVFSVFLAGLLVGCGGGGEQEEAAPEAPEEEAGGEQTGGGQGKGGKGKGGRERADLETANGAVRFVNAENRRIFLLPEEEGGEARPFVVRDNARIQLDGEEAELGDIERGQRAQIEFFVNEEIETPNVARNIAAVNVGGGGGGETTGGG